MSAFNTVGLLMSMGTGLLIARLLGPAIRGQYAAIIAWYGAAIIIGELGQPAAICYFVAHHPDRARDYIATARRLMLLSGLFVALGGWFLAAPLSHGAADERLGYRITFLACPLLFMVGTYSFSLQARSIYRWSIVRSVQPAAYSLGVLGLIAAGHLSLISALIALTGSTAIQGLLAVHWCANEGLTRGHYAGPLRAPLLRFGVTQMLATTPTTINLTLDDLVLSQAVSSSSLGHYAVASSITALAYPLVAPIGFVLFPRLAAEDRETSASRALQRRAILATLSIACPLMAVIAISAWWVVPFVLGGGYRPAVSLILILSPGGVFVSINQVAGDLLRGRNRTSEVALGQGAGAIVTVVLLAVLVPILGTPGAAITSSISYGVTSWRLVGALRRPTPRHRKDRTS